MMLMIFLQLNVIGAVPDDENIVVATNKGQPLVGDDSLCRTGIHEYLP